MGFFSENLSGVTALCSGIAAVAFGAPPVGAVEATVAAAGLAGFVLARQQQFGPECRKVRARIQTALLSDYRQLLSGSDGDPEASDELRRADAALHETLPHCYLDRKALAASAVTSDGFPDRAVALLLGALGSARVDLFGVECHDTLAYRYASDVVRAGITAAIEDEQYYRKLEPHLMFEMAKALGWMREEFRAFGDEQKRQGEEQAYQTDLLERLAAKLDVRESALEGQLEQSQTLLSETRSVLLVLLTDIVGQGVTADQIPQSLAAAKLSLDTSRTELERLRGLTNDVPEIEPHLRAARKALDSNGTIDLAAAQAALNAARVDYQAALMERRAREGDNLSRVIETEASLALARSDYLEGARLYEEAADAISSKDDVRVAELLQNAGEALLTHGSLFPGLTSLRAAVTLHRRATSLVSDASSPKEWAIAQSVLGNSLRQLGDRIAGEEGPTLLLEAIATLETSLRVWTETTFPFQWAQVQNDLCAALYCLADRSGGQDGRKYLLGSVARSNAALRVYSEAESPRAWAATQNNLGNALQLLSEYSDPDERRKVSLSAIAAFEAALRVNTESKLPRSWAETQNNIASVFARLAWHEEGAERRTYLLRAVEALDGTLRVYAENTAPAVWATIQSNLGYALQMLGEREGGIEGRAFLARSVLAFDNALRVRTEADMPIDWAMTQNNLGLARESQGDLVTGKEARAYWVQAVTAYEATLRVFSEQLTPAYWVRVQANLASVRAKLQVAN